METVGRIDYISSFEEWCEGYEFILEKDSYQRNTRRKLINLSESKDKRLWNFIENFTSKEQVKQILLMKYYKGGKLKVHRDLGKHKMAWSISSKDFTFIYDDEEYECKKGYVYNFNGKLKHGLKGTVSNRWTLCWWA